MILRWVSAADDFPEHPEASSRIAPGDCLELLDHLAVGYPELFETPGLRSRLEVYDALWHFVQLLYDGYWQANEPNPRPTLSPAWSWLRSLVEGRSHLQQFTV